MISQRRRRPLRLFATLPDRPAVGTEAEAEAEIEAVGTSSPIAIAAGDGDAPSATGNRRLQIAGVSVTPEVAAIALVYFVQGILGLSRLAKEFFVKDELGLDPAAASLIFTVSSLSLIHI